MSKQNLADRLATVRSEKRVIKRKDDFFRWPDGCYVYQMKELPRLEWLTKIATNYLHENNIKEAVFFHAPDRNGALPEKDEPLYFKLCANGVAELTSETSEAIRIM